MISPGTAEKTQMKKLNKREHSNFTQATKARLHHGSMAHYNEQTNFSSNVSTTKLRTEDA